MKTLQQEIVEALNELANSAISPQINFNLFQKSKQLSEKVLSARCENCEHYYHDNHDEGCKLHQLEYQGPNFGCWNFKEK